MAEVLKITAMIWLKSWMSILKTLEDRYKIVKERLEEYRVYRAYRG